VASNSKSLPLEINYWEVNFRCLQSLCSVLKPSRQCSVKWWGTQNPFLWLRFDFCFSRISDQILQFRNQSSGSSCYFWEDRVDSELWNMVIHFLRISWYFSTFPRFSCRNWMNNQKSVPSILQLLTFLFASISITNFVFNNPCFSFLKNFWRFRITPKFLHFSLTFPDSWESSSIKSIFRKICHFGWFRNQL